MSFFQAFILGLVQGLTEFLPVSSSGHLVLFSKLPWWSEQPLVFDTTLHLATALTLVIYFYKDIVSIAVSFIRDLFALKLGFSKYSSRGKLGLFILLGSIPAAILGFFFESAFETIFRSVQFVALFLLIGAVVMYLAQKLGSANNSIKSLTFKKSFLIGAFQALALFPGMSRSGSTISGGLLVGLPKYDAARFSFLLSIPIVLLAGVYKLVSTDWSSIEVSLGVLSVGFVTSLLSGLAVVHFLLEYLRKRSLNVFIWYRVVLALFLLLFVG